jgi:DNA-directed RNA polymerase subunit M/transcription elongation factor TFIIS
MKESDFCKVCRYYLYLDEVITTDESDEKGAKKELRRVCRNCGYQEVMKGGLILEIDLKEKTSEGYKILMNEFTKDDPTLPHVHNLRCPNRGCLSNKGRAYPADNPELASEEASAPAEAAAKAANEDKGEVESDVIYLKYDAINMKYLYICNVCETKWRSKA